jgi:predicted RNA-binding protein with TRAM domain
MCKAATFDVTCTELRTAGPVGTKESVFVFFSSNGSMEISMDLRCLLTGQVEADGDSYQITVPEREIDLGAIDNNETYRVAIMPAESPTEASSATQSDPADTTHSAQREEPPVDVGDTREVEIDSIGDQGDGIARIDRGYVVIVPNTEVGDRATVRIENAKENVAFAEIVDRHHRLQHD